MLGIAGLAVVRSGRPRRNPRLSGWGGREEETDPSRRSAAGPVDGSRRSAKKSFRQACALTARSQGARRIDAAELAISLVFVPPDRRARDLDNLIAAMKAGLDGLADVLGVDDSRWRHAKPPTIARGEIGGLVRVEVSPWQATNAA
ncbi:MAG: hypothetical protein U1F25_13740 [Rubrivivax sp.]